MPQHQTVTTRFARHGLRNEALQFSVFASAATLGSNRELLQRLDDFLAHLFGVAEQHHRVVAVEQFVLDAGVA
jgi:hypothetical protein